MGDFISELLSLMEKHKCYITGNIRLRADNGDIESYSCKKVSRLDYHNGTGEDGNFLVCDIEFKKPVSNVAARNAGYYVSPDIEGYTCPVTNRWIDGRAAHRENLKRQGCRVFEPGEREQFIKDKPKEIERNSEKAANFFAERMAERLQ